MAPGAAHYPGKDRHVLIRTSYEKRARIFKRFYRVDKVRARDGSFGLGLSIAESIVLSHRGKIWAESSGGINTFCVELPTTKKELTPVR